jgi:hypothetical protein
MQHTLQRTKAETQEAARDTAAGPRHRVQKNQGNAQEESRQKQDMIKPLYDPPGATTDR